MNQNQNQSSAHCWENLSNYAVTKNAEKQLKGGEDQEIITIDIEVG